MPKKPKPKPKDPRGGARAGAGRKKVDEPKTHTIRVTEAEKKLIEDARRPI